MPYEGVCAVEISFPSLVRIRRSPLNQYAQGRRSEVGFSVRQMCSDTRERSVTGASSVAQSSLACAMPTSASWLDIVVEPKQVCRIVLGFDFRQALVVRSIRGFNAVLAFVTDAKEVDVHAAWRGRPHRLPQLARPADVWIVLGGIGPHRDRVQGIHRSTQWIGCVLDTDSIDGSAIK